MLQSIIISAAILLYGFCSPAFASSIKDTNKTSRSSLATIDYSQNNLRTKKVSQSIDKLGTGNHGCIHHGCNGPCYNTQKCLGLSRRTSNIEKICAKNHTELGPRLQNWLDAGYKKRLYKRCKKLIGFKVIKKPQKIRLANYEVTPKGETLQLQKGYSNIIPEETNYREKSQQTNLIVDDTAQRQFEAIYLDLLVSPLNVLLVPSFGIGAGIKFNRKFRMSYSYLKGNIQLGTALEISGYDTDVQLNDERKDLQDDVNDVIDNAEKITIQHGKHLFSASYFAGRSFYLSSGVGVRTIGISYPLDGSADLEGTSATFSVERPGMQFGIGNRWEWENSSFVIDWFDLFIPFSSVDAFSFIDKKGKGSFNEFSSSPDGSLLRIGYGLVLK